MASRRFALYYPDISVVVVDSFFYACSLAEVEPAEKTVRAILRRHVWGVVGGTPRPRRCGR
jgi:hypothetical protein